MLNVLDVSRYIINYSNRKNYDITNLRLQKLLYFIQAYYLVSTEKQEPCFSERIIAWDFGPVILEAYREFKCYGGGSIPNINSYYEHNGIEILFSERMTFDENIIPTIDKRRIEKVVDYFSKYSTTSLVKITHNQDPWCKTYEKQKNKEITKEAIREYFTKQ